MSDKTEYKLSEVERKVLLEIQAEAQRAVEQAIVPFNSQSQGVLILITKQQGLTGTWKLSEDKTTLTKQGT